MKKGYTLLIVIWILIGNSIQAKELSHKKTATLYEHLVTVNIQWTKQKDIPNWIKTEKASFNTDTERIQTHLQLVYQILEKRTKSAQQKRKAVLQKLKRYGQKGEFPTNLYHSYRQPYFVDYKNVHCAVGHLLQQTGELELVTQIRTENNYAYIHELTKYKRLGEWAEEYGFTIDELAWIQPGYGPPNPTFNTVGNGGGVNGEIHAMIQNADSTMLYMAGDFTEVDGQLADNIIGWDGINWHTLGSGIDGVIYAMDFWLGSLVIAGDFMLNGQPCNVAMWTGNNWSALQTGDMQGKVLALKVYNYSIYIGGNFQMVDGNAMPYLAFLPMINQNGSWSNASNYWSTTNAIPNAFTVDAPVRCFELVLDELLVGGDFNQTANLTTDSTINQLSINHLAYWDGDNWTLGLNGQHGAVHSIKLEDGHLYIGGKVSGLNPISIYYAGLWNYISASSFTGKGDSLIHDFVMYDNKMYAVGGFEYIPLLGYFGSGILQIDPAYGYGSGVTSVDKTVKALATFDDQLYLGGDFTQISGQTNANGLVASDMIATNTERIVEETKQIEIRYQGNQVLVFYEDLKETSSMQIIDMKGRVVQTLTIPQGSQTITLETSNWASGMYAYLVQGKAKKETGKIVIH